MSTGYKWPPDIDREMVRNLESIRRQLDAPAIVEMRRQLDQSAAILIQRQLENSAAESTRRYLETIRRQFLALNVLVARMGAPVEEAVRAIKAQSAEFALQLERAIGPLPREAAWRKALSLEFDGLKPATPDFDAISQAISKATLVWSASLPDWEDEDAEQEKPDEPPEEKPSEHLVKLVPAQALRQLEAVDLIPLRVIDQIYGSPREIYRLSPRQFEQLVAELLDSLGFHGIQLTPRSGDQGRDVVAAKRVNGIPVLFAFECKCYAPHRRVGVGVARALLGTVNQAATRADVGVLVTTSTFTRGAQNFFLTEARIKGRDFDGLVEWIEEIKRLRRDA